MPKDFCRKILFTSISLLAVAFGIFGAASASGQTTSMYSIKTIKPKSEKSILENVSGSLTVTGISDFKETSAADKQTVSQYELSLGYKMDETQNVSVYVPVQKNLSGDFEQDFFADARLSHALNNIYKGRTLSFSHTTSAIYPISEGSKVRDEMTAGLQLSPALGLELNSIMSGLGFTYIPRYTRLFHKFTQNREGETLVNESFAQIFVASLQLSDKWSLSSTLVYVISHRYDGARTDDSYMTAQGIAYSPYKTFSLSAGIQTGGNLINPERGQSQTIEVFDENLSQFYTAAKLAF